MAVFPRTLPDLGDDIDRETFAQICDMDEDEDQSFSLTIVEEFFEQAYETFKEMDDLLEKEDLAMLSERGHYLKGSSATVGLIKMKDSCEKIQRYGQMEDLDGVPISDREECQKGLKKSLARVKIQCNRAERILKSFYGLPIPAELPADEEEEAEEAAEKAAQKAQEQEKEKEKEKETEKETGKVQDGARKAATETKTDDRKDE